MKYKSIAGGFSMESNGRFYARPFNELHVGEIGKEPLSSERVAIEERFIFVRFVIAEATVGKGPP